MVVSKVQDVVVFRRLSMQFGLVLDSGIVVRTESNRRRLCESRNEETVQDFS